jgi:hypothetical protein
MPGLAVKLSLAICLAVTVASFARADEPRRPDVMVFILNASAIDNRPCGNGSIAYSSIALSGTTKSRGRAVFIEKISSIS